MAESMVERVAKAICRQANLDDGYADNATLQASIDGGMWRNHTGQARAAIEAMREPTDEMIVAGYNAADLWNASAHPMSNVIMRAKATYEGMLDAALAETKEEPHG